MSEKNKDLIKALLNKKMLTILFLGFSSGLPLLLIGGTLKLWLSREGINIKTIGYFGWIGMAYSLKFLWAPFLDRFGLSSLGRRRSWILLTQLAISIAFVVISQLTPQLNLTFMVITALVIAFFSASQDIAIDAYRREVLKDLEQGLGSSFSAYGYRIAMLISGGVGIGLVGTSPFYLSWNKLYFFMAILMALCSLVTLAMPEPEASSEKPTSFLSAVVDPFLDFFKKDKALLILCFVILFKLGDALSGAMLNPFYAQMGYTNEEIGFVAKTIGLLASMLGLLLGGIILYKWEMTKTLYFFGILQALSTAGFALITFTGAKIWALGFAIVFEDISAGMGNAAFVAYLASLTNRKFTGTQYALLSSLATLGRNFFSGFSGNMVSALGWANFFYICSLIALPGLLLIRLLPLNKKEEV